jgi:hypothetical protein
MGVDGYEVVVVVATRIVVTAAARLAEVFQTGKVWVKACPVVSHAFVWVTTSESQE